MVPAPPDAEPTGGSPPDRSPLVEFSAHTSVPWSAEFVTQSLEAILVYLADDGTARRLRPVHADALWLGWSSDAQPGEIVLEAIERYGLHPLLVHSTSWRHEQGRLVLTYVAAVSPPNDLGPFLIDEPIERTDLARGDALGPPADIGLAQVIEHAFRHLSWLVKDDDAVGAALSDWKSFLAAFEPEPFRALGGP